jgi:hypothetical protein
MAMRALSLQITKANKGPEEKTESKKKFQVGRALVVLLRRVGGLSLSEHLTILINTAPD